MNWKNHFYKKVSSKNEKQNQCQNAACEQKTTSEKGKIGSNKKLGIEGTINGLAKPLKKRNPKMRKNSQNQSEIPACEQKTTSEKANFCLTTVFSLLKTTPLFRFISCFVFTLFLKNAV